MTAPRWRPGRKVGRTLYIHQGDADTGQLVGLVDTPELAAAICDAMNGNAAQAEAAVQRSREALARIAFGPVPTSRAVLNAWRESLNCPEET